ncbi:hypothetical protein M405DRAFT_92887 [Rhizopogon salebrosus TDB-379]|nr:hypothetical protein M405DRAFT_92887 [Rhizopogon salebrosus TDB-379]
MNQLRQIQGNLNSVISCRKHVNEPRTIAHDSDYSCIVYSSKIRVQIVREQFELAGHDVALSQRFSHCPIFTGPPPPTNINIRFSHATPYAEGLHRSFPTPGKP